MEKVDGKLQGPGRQKFEKDGQEYILECTWEKGKKNGEGNFLDPNGILLMKLHFTDDVVNGEGCLYSDGKISFKGMWKDGKRCGPCIEYQNGYKVYEGEYKDDMRNGFGTEYDETGVIVFEGEWVNGKPGNKFIEKKKKLVEKDENGKIRYMGGFKEGTVIRDGEGVEYDENENPINSCIYENGVMVRKVKEFKGKEIVLYDENGKIRYQGGYSDKEKLGYPPNGKGKQYENGVLVYSGSFVKGYRDGQGNAFYPSHTMKYEGDWKNDKANGMGKFYDEEGLLVAEGEFVDNVYRDVDKICHVDTGKIEKIKKRGCFC